MFHYIGTLDEKLNELRRKLVKVELNIHCMKKAFNSNSITKWLAMIVSQPVLIKSI